MVSPQIMAANTGLRIGSMPEVNAAVTGETASSPRDRQMVARPVCTAPRSTITSHMDGVDGFVHSSRKADDESQNIADDMWEDSEIAAFHFLHLKHNGIGQAEIMQEDCRSMPPEVILSKKKHTILINAMMHVRTALYPVVYDRRSRG